MAKSHLHLVTPATENLTVSNNPNGRKHNKDYRSREHLLPSEVDALIAAAKQNRYGHRDATMIRLAYHHGLRAAELVSLSWAQINLDEGIITVERVKGSKSGDHPLLGEELRALRRLKRENPHSNWVFMTERKAPFTTDGFAAMVRRAGAAANLGLKVHPHMLRHACGYALGNRGMDTRALQAYLGHRNIQNTARYVEMAANRFKGIWA